MILGREPVQINPGGKCWWRMRLISVPLGTSLVVRVAGSDKEYGPFGAFQRWASSNCSRCHSAATRSVSTWSRPATRAVPA